MDKRKRRREAEMFPVMEHYEESGLTQREFCREADLPQSVFQYWWRRYRESRGDREQSMDGGGFVELRAARGAIGDHGSGLELLLGDGAVLRFSGGLPPADYLAGLIQQLRRC